MVDTKLTDHKHHTFMDTGKTELIYCKYYNNTIIFYEYGDISSIVVSMKLEVNTC